MPDRGVTPVDDPQPIAVHEQIGRAEFVVLNGRWNTRRTEAFTELPEPVRELAQTQHRVGFDG
jgi:hypothetical protein